MAFPHLFGASPGGFCCLALDLPSISCLRNNGRKHFRPADVAESLASLAIKSLDMVFIHIYIYIIIYIYIYVLMIRIDIFFFIFYGVHVEILY